MSTEQPKPGTRARSGRVAPRRAVELVAREVTLRGGRLAVAIRCRESGSATLRRKKRTVARASFTCSHFRATVSFKLPAREAKAVRRGRRTRLTAVVRVGRKRVRLAVVVRSGRGVARAAFTRAWAQSVVYCGSNLGDFYSDQHGLSVDPGAASSYDGRYDDWMAYTIWIYTPGVGWKSGMPGAGDLQENQWSSWFHTPAAGGVQLGEDRFGRRRGAAAWAYVVIQKYWYNARRSEYIYPTVDSRLGGIIYPGGWCWWTN